MKSPSTVGTLIVRIVDVLNYGFTRMQDVGVWNMVKKQEQVVWAIGQRL